VNTKRTITILQGVDELLRPLWWVFYLCVVILLWQEYQLEKKGL